MPAENYYPEMPEDQDSASSTPSPNPPAEDEKSEGEDTALLPISILAGKKFEPGDELVLEVVHIYEDEVEVKYAKGEDESSEKPGPKRMRRRVGRPREGMAGAMERLDMMAEEGE